MTRIDETAAPSTNGRVSSGSHTKPPGSGRGSRFWPGFVIALIGGQMLLCMVPLYYATAAGPPAVEPDYYKKAVNWNEHAAQVGRNAELGWRAAIEVSEAAADGGRAATVILTTAGGGPLEGAAVRGVVFHHADSNRRIEVRFAPEAAGRYAARLPISRQGVWEFRLTATRGADTFTYDEQVDVGRTVGMFRWSP